MKQIRLLPVVVLAASALLVLKSFGIVSGHGYILSGVSVAQASGGGQAAEAEVVPEAPATETEPELSPAEAAAQALFEAVPSEVPEEGGINVQEVSGGAIVDVDPDAGSSEALILQRLAERRAELDAFANELETRLAVVEAAEIRIEERMTELSAMEAEINALVDARDSAEAEQFAAIVAMYESMRANDAATIFNDLDRDVLVSVGREMSPRKLGPIMAEMEPSKAQELTVLLAQTGSPATAEPVAQDFANLPQIVGQ